MINPSSPLSDLLTRFQARINKRNPEPNLEQFKHAGKDKKTQQTIVSNDHISVELKGKVQGQAENPATYNKPVVLSVHKEKNLNMFPGQKINLPQPDKIELQSKLNNNMTEPFQKKVEEAMPPEKKDQATEKKNIKPEEQAFQALGQGYLQQFKNAWGSKSGEENFDSTFDFDGNGEINIFDSRSIRQKFQEDTQGIKQTFGSKAGQDNYNPSYDYDQNGVVDVFDLKQLRQKWIG